MTPLSDEDWNDAWEVQIRRILPAIPTKNAHVQEHAGRSVDTNSKDKMMSSTLFARAASGSGGSAPKKTAETPDQQWLRSSLHRAKTTGRFAEFHDLTPGIASALLERNPSNRPLTRRKVDEWCAALRNGEWEENGETIVVSIDGELNDGQHRCCAVVETGISMPVCFSFGLTRNSRKTVDQGAKRTAGHVLGMSDIPSGKNAAAALRIVLNLEAGIALNTSHSTKAIEIAYGRNPTVLDDSHAALCAARRYKQSGGLFLALNFMLRRNHPGHAAEFFHMLASGVAPHANHPVARLSARLGENLSAKAKLPITEVAAIVIKAMDAFISGRDVVTLRWNSAGAERNGKKTRPEAFPKVP